ncbi:MAG: patatin-like phospholipase family protein [Anaerolineae bacterium]|nr:patatin-like phospholipase family protein [Anaerolineae bacterium]
MSIDGGGMRGLIPIAMLAELEAQLGQPVQEIVDMVGGTSSGAIIAAGMGLGMTAQEILDEVYKTRLPAAFPSRNLFFWLRYLFGGLRHFYSLEPFLEALKPLAEGKRIRDLQHPIVLMVTKDLRTSNSYFIVSRGPGASAFGHWPVAGAVGASGAAPVYFPPVLGNLVDGGVGEFGNPCMAVAVEALEYIGPEAGFIANEVILLSLGTGYLLNTLADGEGSRWNITNWVPYYINEALDDAALQQAFSTRAIYGEQMDFRRYNPLLTTENIVDRLGLQIPRGVQPEKLGLDSTSTVEIDLMEAIGRAYAHAIDWRISGLMPWDTIGGHPKPAITPVNWTGSAYV